MGFAYLPVFLVWDVCGFFLGLRESWGLFIYLGTKWWIVFFFELLFFSGAVLWQGKNKKDLRNQ